MIELMQLPPGEETYRAPRKNSYIGVRRLGVCKWRTKSLQKSKG